jgi:hypothetical protein
MLKKHFDEFIRGTSALKVNVSVCFIIFDRRLEVPRHDELPHGGWLLVGFFFFQKENFRLGTFALTSPWVGCGGDARRRIQRDGRSFEYGGLGSAAGWAAAIVEVLP